MASIVSAGTTSATALNMSADTSGVLQLASNNGTVALTVTAAQDVGVGLTNPGTYAKFAVQGSGPVNSIMTQTAAFLSGGANGLFIGTDGTDVLMGTGNSGTSLSLLSRVGGVFSKALNINSSGYVTTPFQPSFTAFLTSGNISTLGVPIAFNSVQFNTSSSYNNATGRFTAPVTGTYIFFTSGITASGTVIELGAYINNGTQIGNCRQSGGSAGTNTGCATTFSWPLIAGDYVDVRLQAGTAYGNGVFTAFGGYLIG